MGPPYGNRSGLAPVLRDMLAGSLAARAHDGCGDTGNLRATRLGLWELARTTPLVFCATVDVVASCTDLFPGDAAYFAGIAQNDNVLFGEVAYLDPLVSNCFDLPGAYGWMLLVFPPSYDQPFTDLTPEPYGYLTHPTMGWAALRFEWGGYSCGSEAITLSNALCFPTQVMPDLGTNDGTAPIR